MGFSFVTPFDDIARVRWAIADTDPDAHRFSDEIITAVIDEADGWQGAVISCLDAIIAELSGAPKFEADWLKIDPHNALKHYEKLRATKQAEYGISGGSVGLSGAVIVPDRSDRS